MERELLAIKAYGAYRASMAERGYKPLPPWENLHGRKRLAWSRVVDALTEQATDEGEGHVCHACDGTGIVP